MPELPCFVVPFDRPEVEACEYIGPEGWYWSKGNRLYRSENHSGRLELVARIPLGGIRRYLAKSRLGRRFARQTVYNILPLNHSNRIFFSFDKMVGIIEDAQVHHLAGRLQDSRTLRNGIARLPDGTVVFGDYINNEKRRPVNIYKLPPTGTTIELAYSFPSGSIRHIHSVSWDPYAKRIIVATGDVGEECKLASFDTDFTEMSVIGEGCENWRLISPQFTKDAIYFGTDAEFQLNGIYRYDRHNGRLSSLGSVNGPVFYSVPYATGWLFATAAELCASQTSPEAILYYLDEPTGHLQPITKFAKDCLSTKYFQFGLYSLPIVDSAPGLLPVSGVALRGLDGKFIGLQHKDAEYY